MKKNLFRIILTVAFIMAAVWFLIPTWTDYKVNQEVQNMTGDDSLKYVTDNAEKIKKALNRRLKLGLDLKGGMYVVLDVDVVKLLEDLAKPSAKNDEVFVKTLQDLAEVSTNSDQSVLKQFSASLKAQGKSILNYYGDSRQTEAQVETEIQDKIDKAIDGAKETLRSRIDQYGVAEPQIQLAGGKRIIVELPGVKNPDEVRRLLKQTAVLNFQLLKDSETAFKIIQELNKVVAAKQNGDTNYFKNDSLKMKKDSTFKKDTTKLNSNKVDTKKIQKDSTKVKKDTTKTKKDSTASKKDTTKSDTSNATDTTQNLSQEEFLKKNPLLALFDLQYLQNSGEFVTTDLNKIKIDLMLKMEEVKAVIPSDVQLLWSQPKNVQGTTFYYMYVVKKDPELTGKVIENARADIDPQTQQPRVSMSMSADGANEWARITGANIKKRCAIVLDGVVYTAPTIQNKISGGNSEITGIPNIAEAKLLEIVLRAGSLPAPLRIIEERSIGPSLGEDAIKAGVNSSIAALILVALFMIFYYRLGGAVSVFALLINVLFVFGIMAQFKSTLTVPGIAGLILSIGMAVDTNVLIYERIREEMKTGKPMLTSLQIGYDKAFSAIIDSHITSIITAVMLWAFGSGPIQGFALTLLFGILSNLFTAIVITHFIFDVLLEKGNKLNFG